MKAHETTELLGGTWTGNHGVVPCSTLHPGPDLDAWRLSISDFETGVWFNLDREGPGPGPSTYLGPWYDASETPDSSDDFKLPDIEEVKAVRRDLITLVREAEQHYEEERRRSEWALAIWN